MLAFTNAKEKTSPTVIGAGCKLTGNIHTEHSIQIHGSVVGDIVAETIIIGRGGMVKGKITATNLFLHGSLDGPATVDIANIFGHAKMTGTLSYRTLNITANNGLECKLAKREDKKHE